MAETVHCNHDALKQVAGQFDSDSNIVKQATTKLESQLQALKGGGWRAPAATKFFGIMEHEILVGLNRLSAGLGQGSQVTNQVSAIMAQAEEQAKGSLNF
jgi:WXG100 family type VII secretion target